MRVVSDGRTIGYELAGNAPRALLFLPALGTGAAMWADQMERFHSEYTVIAPEVGSRDSHAGPPRASLEDFARDVEAVIDAVGVADAHIVGISLGGAIAQVLALEAPDRIRSLVLVSTTSEYPAPARTALRERAQKAEQEGMEALVQPTLDRWFTPEFRETAGGRIEPIRRMLQTADPVVYAEGARAVARVDTTSRLCKIDSPALVVHAAGDRSMPEGSAARLEQMLQNAHLVRLDRAAHLCPVEQPEEFGNILADFLASVEATREDQGLDDPVLPW